MTICPRCGRGEKIRTYEQGKLQAQKDILEIIDNFPLHKFIKKDRWLCDDVKKELKAQLKENSGEKEMDKKWSDYGESSLTIVSVLIGVEKENPTIPQDPADFVRCIHLFDCLRYDKYRVFSLIERVAQKYPVWNPLVENWDKLMDLYFEERNLESAPKLYDLLQKCRISTFSALNSPQAKAEPIMKDSSDNGDNNQIKELMDKDYSFTKDGVK